MNIRRVIESKQATCRDPAHCHNSPVQKMLAVDINGHYVEITQDGERYHARIDGGPARFNLTPNQLEQFIQENT